MWYSAHLPLFRLGNESRPMQVIANESKNLLVMFLGEDEFHIATVSHCIAKKARGVTAHSLFKDPFQSVDDETKQVAFSSSLPGVRITMFRQSVTLNIDSLPMDAATPPASPDTGWGDGSQQGGPGSQTGPSPQSESLGSRGANGEEAIA